jgi:hypothetical protein
MPESYDARKSRTVLVIVRGQCSARLSVGAGAIIGSLEALQRH